MRATGRDRGGRVEPFVRRGVRAAVVWARARDARVLSLVASGAANHGETSQMANQFGDDGGFGLDDELGEEGGGFHLESESLDDDAEGELLETDGVLALKPDPEPQLTREQRRSRRKRDVRARTISVKRLSKAELERGLLLFPD